MNLQTFFQKFDQFADAPDAVAKMRELVLELAVQGKLVDQKHSDESAAQLLAAISKERDTRAVKLRTPDEPESADDKKPAFPIPSNWAWTQLGNIALQIQYGYTASADPSATEIRMLRITDIQNNRVDWPSVPGCQIESDEAAKYLLSPNDILIARTGGTIGKSFIVPDAPVKSVFASYLIRVTPPRSMEARYLKTFLEAPLYWTQLRQMSAGTGQPNVNGQALGRLAIPLPPLAEQKRIVAKVNELMALCDRLEAQQQERGTRHAALARASLSRFADAPTPANLHFLFHPSYAISPADIRKSILTLAVQGKLVPQDPNDEPADELLKRIAAEQERLVKARQIRRLETAPLNEDEEPFGIPANWAWTRLGQIGDWGSGSTPPRGNHELYGGGIAWLKSGELNDNRTLAGSEETVTELAVKTCSFRLNKPGDVLLAMYGATIGKAAILAEPAVTNQAVCGCTPFPGVLNTYLFDYLLSQRDAFHAASEGGAQPNISKVKIVGYPFPLPPLAEQRRIVAKVEQLMALVDALEQQLAASRATAANLLTALVAELTTLNGGSNET